MPTTSDCRTSGRRIICRVLFILCALPLAMGQSCAPATTADSGGGSSGINSCTDMNGTWYVWKDVMNPYALTFQNCTVTAYQNAFVASPGPVQTPLASQVTLTTGANGAKHLVIEFTIPYADTDTQRNKIEGDLRDGTNDIWFATWYKCTYVNGAPSGTCQNDLDLTGHWPAYENYHLTQYKPFY